MRHYVNIECKIKTDHEIDALFHNQGIPVLEVVLSSLRITGAE